MNNIQSKNIADLLPAPEAKAKALPRAVESDRNDRFQGTNERVFISELRDRIREKRESSTSETNAHAADKVFHPVKKSPVSSDETKTEAKTKDLSKTDETVESNTTAAVDKDISEDKLEGLDKAIAAKVKAIQALLQKLGITSEPEQITSPDFLDKAVQILAAFITQLKTAAPESQVMPEAGVTQDVSAVVTVGIVGADASEQDSAIIAALSDILKELKTLIEFKDFLEKSAAAAGQGAVLLADKPNIDGKEQVAINPESKEQVATSPVVVVESDDAGEVTDSETTVPVTLEKLIAETVVSSEEKGETAVTVGVVEIKQNAGQVNASSHHTLKKQKSEESVSVQAETQPDIQKTASSEAKPVEIIPTAANTKKESKPEMNESVVQAVVAETNKKKPETNKPVQETENIAQPIASQEGEEAKKSILPTLKSETNNQNETEKQAKQEIPAEALTKTETTDKPASVKTLSELKDALSHALMQAKNDVQATDADLSSAKSRASSYVSHDRAVPEKAVLHQITTKFQLLTGQHGSEVRVQLKPDQLGSIKISIEVVQDTVTTRMQVENEKVKQIIESNMQTLKNALEESGIKVEKFEVTVDQGQGEFFHRELSEQGRRARGLLRTQVSGEGEEGEGLAASGEQAETGRRYGYNTVEYVG